MKSCNNSGRGGYQKEEDIDLFRDRQWMVVGTNTFLFLLNADSHEVQLLQNLQKPIYKRLTEEEEFQNNTTPEDQSISTSNVGILIKFAKLMIFQTIKSKSSSIDGIQCGILSAFDPCFTNLTLDVESKLSISSNVSEISWHQA